MVGRRNVALGAAWIGFVALSVVLVGPGSMSIKLWTVAGVLAGSFALLLLLSKLFPTK